MAISPFSCQVFCKHLSYNMYLPFILRLLHLNGLIIFNWQLIAQRINRMTSPVNDESLSIMSSFGQLKLHIALQMSISAMTSAVLDLIGILSTPLVISQIGTKRYLKSWKPIDKIYVYWKTFYWQITYRYSWVIQYTLYWLLSFARCHVLLWTFIFCQHIVHVVYLHYITWIVQGFSITYIIIY